MARRDVPVKKYAVSKLADVHQRSGDKKKARDYSLQAQTIMARLTKLSPDNAQWKQESDQFDRDMMPGKPNRCGRHPRRRNRRRRRANR
jgi:hypothetical protein